MVQIVEWNGFKWRRYPDSARSSDRMYFKRTTPGGESIALHRAVWGHHFGVVPADCHIHHVDGDSGNNDPSNLECLPAEVHRRHHAMEEWSGERLKRQREHLDAIRDKTKEWHASEDGREVHRRVGRIAYERFEPVAKPCAHCAASFLPRKIGNADKFCSNACKSAFRRARGLDHECRQCSECGSQFRVNRYSKTQNCSRACGNRARGRLLREGLRPDGSRPT